MNFGRSDLRKVQVSVLGAVLMLLVAAIVLYVAYQLRDKAQLARVAITAQRSDADGKLKRVRDEENEITPSTAGAGAWMNLPRPTWARRIPSFSKSS